HAQPTGLYGASAQTLNRVIWSTKIDLNNNGGYARYGAPLITASNAVLVPMRTTNGFRVNAFEGKTGRLKYSLATDYIPQPGLAWHPPYQPAIAVSSVGTRLYYAGSGGTVYYIDEPDSDAPAAPVQQCFYTN